MNAAAASVHQSENLLFFTLLQLIVMIGAARLLNTLFRRLDQPGVIGEIVAGLALGPSLLGHLFPAFSLALFGEKASPAITIISQIGLILLMFQIGADFHFTHLKSRRNARAVMAVTAASISVPLLLGVLLGRVTAPVLAPGIDATNYSLFMGVGMAITAVPILGRILRQYDLTRTEVGVVAISSAAINDVIGWVLLAGISAYALSHGQAGVVIASKLVGLLAFGAALFFLLRPLATWLVARFPTREGEITPNLLAIIVCLVFVLGMCTYKLGIFAIFGGFAAGLLFYTHTDFVAAWRRQVGGFVMVFFLPVFFTFTGLRTNVLGLTSATDLLWLAVILAAAILGKVVPVYFAARSSGFARDEAAILGSLMNTRALMELIVLNIGLDFGFIPQKVFTMMVIMAVVTTVMTGPLMKLLLPRIGHPIPVGVEA